MLLAPAFSIVGAPAREVKNLGAAVHYGFLERQPEGREGESATKHMPAGRDHCMSQEVGYFVHGPTAVVVRAGLGLPGLWGGQSGLIHCEGCGVRKVSEAGHLRRRGPVPLATGSCGARF